MSRELGSPWRNLDAAEATEVLLCTSLCSTMLTLISGWVRIHITVCAEWNCFSSPAPGSLYWVQFVLRFVHSRSKDFIRPTIEPRSRALMYKYKLTIKPVHEVWDWVTDVVIETHLNCTRPVWDDEASHCHTVCVTVWLSHIHTHCVARYSWAIQIWKPGATLVYQGCHIMNRLATLGLFVHDGFPRCHDLSTITRKRRYLAIFFPRNFFDFLNQSVFIIISNWCALLARLGFSIYHSIIMKSVMKLLSFSRSHFLYSVDFLWYFYGV